MGQQRAASPTTGAAFWVSLAYGTICLPLAFWLSLEWMSEWTTGGISNLGHGLAAVGVVALGYWYVVGLAWGSWRGLGGAALGGPLGISAALLLWARVTGTEMDGDSFSWLLIWATLPALFGLLGYPVGFLARWLFRWKPPLGMLAGLLLLSVGVWAAASSSPPPDPYGMVYATPSVSMICAPALLLAGVGTLLLGSVWQAVLRRSADGASGPA